MVVKKIASGMGSGVSIMPYGITNKFLVVAVAVEVGGDDVGTGGHQLFDGTER